MQAQRSIFVQQLLSAKNERLKFEAWAHQALDVLPRKEQERCLRIKAKGLGICAKCRWKHGCLRCDFPKAVRYHLQRLTSHEVEEPFVSTPLQGGGSGALGAREDVP